MKIINTGGQVSGCFDRYTLVKTHNDIVPIQNIKVGDKVYCLDGKIRKVIKVWKYGKSFVKRFVYGNDWFFDCTNAHELYIKRGEQTQFTKATNVQIGDALIDGDGEPLIIKYIGLPIEVDNVYDLEIEEMHNYRICGKSCLPVTLTNNETWYFTNEELTKLGVCFSE